MSKSNRKVVDYPSNSETVSRMPRKRYKSSDLQSINPITENHNKFVKLCKRDIPLILATGPSGTGKTYLALHSALEQVLDSSSPYEKVIIIRSAVEARKQGFLKGELDDKNAPFETPYVQSTIKLFPNDTHPYEALKADGKLEFMTTGYLRGQTFDNAIILCDEMQNCDYDELSTIITRIGLYSKIVLMGDIKQCDLQRTKEKSGFEKLKNVMQRMDQTMVSSMEFTLDDIVRSGLVKEFLIADYYMHQ